MRNLFLALLLANLAFAAWHAWLVEPVGTVSVNDPALPSIMLVSEVPEDLRSSGIVRESTPGVATPPVAPVELAAEPPEGELETTTEAAAAPASDAVPAAATEAVPRDASAVAAAVAARCTSVGPFRELSQAATAAAALRAAGHSPEQRIAEGDIWIGYWVYIEAIPTEAEANDILAKVRADGVTDSYVIPNSDTGNLVSLGVFSEISGVSRRREQVRALGYEPQVVDRTRRATVYWIDVELAADQTLDFDALQTPGRIIRLEQRECAAADG